MSKGLIIAAGVLAFAGSATAEQVLLLRTGFSIRAEHHDRIGDRVRITSKDGGTTEIAADSIVRVEEWDSVDAEPESTDSREPVKEVFVIDDVVAAHSATNRLHPELLYSVIAAESNFDPQALSSKGAIGLMQLMPETAVELEVDPHDPAENVQGGAKYLRFLLDKYAGRKDQLVRAVAAYNAGPAAVDRYDGIPPYQETRQFVSRVLKRFVALAESTPR